MKKKSKGLFNTKIYKWFMDVKFIQGLFDIVYATLFMTFIDLGMIGFGNHAFKSYFEILVIMGFLILFVWRLDIKISNSNNGFFTVNLWILEILFVIGLFLQKYTLFFYGFRLLGAFIGIYITFKGLEYLNKHKVINIW